MNAPVIPERLKRLPELATDLWWTWNTQAREVFRKLDYPLWRQTAHNPVRMLQMISPERLAAMAGNTAWLALYDDVMAGEQRTQAPVVLLAIGQVVGSVSPYVALVGSGFLLNVQAYRANKIDDVDGLNFDPHTGILYGSQRERRDNGDRTTTHRYYQEDVHDFAWTASPDGVGNTRTAASSTSPITTTLLRVPNPGRSRSGRRGPPLPSASSCRRPARVACASSTSTSASTTTPLSPYARRCSPRTC